MKRKSNERERKERGSVSSFYLLRLGPLIPRKTHESRRCLSPPRCSSLPFLEALPALARKRAGDNYRAADLA